MLKLSQYFPTTASILEFFAPNTKNKHEFGIEHLFPKARRFSYKIFQSFIARLKCLFIKKKAPPSPPASPGKLENSYEEARMEKLASVGQYDTDLALEMRVTRKFNLRR